MRGLPCLQPSVMEQTGAARGRALRSTRAGRCLRRVYQGSNNAGSRTALLCSPRPGSPSSRNEDVTFVDRGTQTVPHVPLFLPAGQPPEREVHLPEPPSLFTLSPSKQLKVRSALTTSQGSSTGMPGCTREASVCCCWIARVARWAPETAACVSQPRALASITP